MNEMKRVQVQPCLEDGDGHVVRCDQTDADYFGVYFGTLGDFEWVADFATKTDAVAYAKEIATDYNCELEIL